MEQTNNFKQKFHQTAVAIVSSISQRLCHPTLAVATTPTGGPAILVLVKIQAHLTKITAQKSAKPWFKFRVTGRLWQHWQPESASG